MATTTPDLDITFTIKRSDVIAILGALSMSRFLAKETLEKYPNQEEVLKESLELLDSAEKAIRDQAGLN
jgi:hypothetical protein